MPVIRVSWNGWIGQLSWRFGVPRPVKWSRDVHAIRERAQRSNTETWSRQDIEHLFSLSRPSAQSLMKAIGGVQAVGSAHFVERASLLAFLSEMIAADSLEEALRLRFEAASPVPRPRALRITLPVDLRRIMLPDLPDNVRLSPGRIEITADTPSGLAEALMLLATVMQNDLDRWERAVTLPAPTSVDSDLLQWISEIRTVK